MELKQVGEFGLIDLIKEDTIIDPSSVVLGIGDDAAVLLPTPHRLQLLTTDMLVERVHFDLNTTTPWQLGYKAIAVNLSDIAAMGGSPKQVVISLALTPSIPVDFVVNLYKGMKEICRQFNVNIVGGDTVSSPHSLVINVAALGEVEPTRLQRRAGAKPGDLIVVTGVLGSSAVGLDFLLKGGWEDYAFAWPLVTAHLTPQPQVRAGQIVAAFANSMDDISDGLASEINELAAASKAGMCIYAQNIPQTPELCQAAEFLGKSALDYALYGGEDFQLVFTIEPDQYQRLILEDIGVKLTVVGEVVNSADGVMLVAVTGEKTKLEPRGYNHFR